MTTKERLARTVTNNNFNASLTDNQTEAEITSTYNMFRCAIVQQMLHASPNQISCIAHNINRENYQEIAMKQHH